MNAAGRSRRGTEIVEGEVGQPPARIGEDVPAHDRRCPSACEVAQLRCAGRINDMDMGAVLVGQQSSSGNDIGGEFAGAETLKVVATRRMRHNRRDLDAAIDP